MKSGFRLSVEAENDIVKIAQYGVRLFGKTQAHKYHDELFSVFELLASHPQMARLRYELIPPVRIHRFRTHLIVYIEEPDNRILILRVRHGHEDWGNSADE